MLKKIEGLKAFLDIKRKIMITTHINPDGDAMGSSLGLYHFLKENGHEVTIVVPNSYPDYLAWLPEASKSVIFQTNKEAGKKAVEEAEIIFCLDFNDLKRITDLGDLIKEKNTPKVLIDHHPEPMEFASYIFHDDTASSTAELVFDFIHEINDKHHISIHSAYSLYTGLMTDTGNFQFASTTPKILRIAADLIDIGVRNYKAFDLVYNHYSETRMRFFGYCITNRMRVLEEYNAALIYVTEEDQKKFDVQKGDTEGLVNLPLQIKGIKLAALMLHKDDIIKISLRSKGEFDVNRMARKYFNGGGHSNASGGSSYDSLETTINRFYDILPEYKDQLTN